MNPDRLADLIQARPDLASLSLAAKVREAVVMSS